MKFTLFIFSAILALSCTYFNGNEKSKQDQELRENMHAVISDDILCEAFLLGADEVKLYDEINGKVIGTVQNNHEEEVFYSVEIYSQKGNWFNIRASAMGDTLSGWIENESYLATYSRNYTDTLFVYLEDNEKEVVCSIPDYFTSPMKIIECKKDWVKVEIQDNDLACKGWVLQSMTCSSPYTTCP